MNDAQQNRKQLESLRHVLTERMRGTALELPPQTEPVRFKVEWFTTGDKVADDHDRYYFEEHTCPTNWLRDVREVAIGGDTDPHGLWKFVAAYDADAEASAALAMLQQGPATNQTSGDNGQRVQSPNALPSSDSTPAGVPEGAGASSSAQREEP